MTIDKVLILPLPRSLGQHDQASKASSELPGKIDTSNTGHASMLPGYGIDPAAVGDKLGGLGKLL